MGSIRRPHLALLSLLAALLASRTSRAEEPEGPPLGRAREVVLDDLVGVRAGNIGYLGQLGLGGLGALGGLSGAGFTGLVGYAHTSSSTVTTSVAGSQAPASSTTSSASTVSVWVDPAFDVFVVRRVSFGAAFAFLYQRQSSESSGPFSSAPSNSYSFSAVPRLGYAVPVGSSVALWPRLGVGFTRSQTNTDLSKGSGGVLPTRSLSVLGGLDLGIVYRAARYLVLHASPQVSFAYTVTKSNGVPGTKYSSEVFSLGVGGTAGVGLVF